MIDPSNRVTGHLILTGMVTAFQSTVWRWLRMPGNACGDALS